MHSVESFRVGDEYVTDVWAATNRVLAPIKKLQKKKRGIVNRLMMLIDRCAKCGFDDCPKVVQHREHGVYVIGDRHGPLLRIAGFHVYRKDKQRFVMMGFYEKHGQSMRGSETDLIREVKRIRDKDEWFYEQTS